MFLPSHRVTGSASHYHLNNTLVILIIMPFRSEFLDLIIEVNAYPPAHANDHTLAVQNLKAIIKML